MQKLKDLVIEILRTADQDCKLASIAFPALGTGNLRYPAGEVAKVMVEGAVDYLKQNPSCGIQQMVVVIYNKDQSTERVCHSQY